MTGMPPSLSPTLLAWRASGLPAAPTVHPHEGEPCACARCGARIGPGDGAAPHEIGDNFVDYLDLAAPESDWVCAGCATLTQSPHVKSVSGNFGPGAVITEQAWYRASKNVEAAYWALNPPEGFWLWSMQTTQGQHVLWRANVNQQREAYRIQQGAHSLLVRLQALRALLHATQEFQLTHGKSLPYIWTIDKEAKTLTSRGQPVAAVAGTAIESVVLEATPGECWAVAKVAYAGMKRGVMPELPTPEPLAKPLPIKGVTNA